jgi:hypothetical protein
LPQIYQQKVKHLLYEQQNNITTLKADTELALKLQQDEFAKREAELNRDKRALKQELREQVRQLTLVGTYSCTAVCRRSWMALAQQQLCSVVGSQHRSPWEQSAGRVLP